jgi:DnaJ-class molecular chaperone
VKIDDIIECDHVLRVPGKGMPRRSGRGYGDLYITFEVDFPDKLSQQQKDALKATLSQSNSGQDEL